MARSSSDCDADERRLAGSVGAFAAVCQGSGEADLILQAKTAAGDRKARHQRARDQPMTRLQGQSAETVTGCLS